MSGRTAGKRLLGSVITAFAMAALAAPVDAGPRNLVTGTISEVDLSGSPRVIKVTTGDGQEVVARIANRTRVEFEKEWAPYYPTPELSNLQAGMGVRFNDTGDVLAVVQVTFVPKDKLPARAPTGGLIMPGIGGAPATGSGTREVKARVQSIDDRRGEFRADVGGRSESFAVRDNRLMRRIEEGDLVLLTVRGANEVTDIKFATLAGRVVSIDRNRKEVRIDVNGKVEPYGLDDTEMFSQVRDNLQIRFEYEDRPGGRKVITAIR